MEISTLHEGNRLQNKIIELKELKRKITEGNFNSIRFSNESGSYFFIVATGKDNRELFDQLIGLTTIDADAKIINAQANFDNL